MRALHLVITKDPSGRGSLGGSSGGCAAFTMGWFHPELYTRILSYSGGFVPLQANPPLYPDGAGQYGDRLVAASPLNRCVCTSTKGASTRPWWAS
jgi:S-formylglutathione hydrolase FrmB